MNRVLVVGSLNMDLIVETDRIPVIGETVLGRGFATALGGKGANQAAAAARLGAQTAMLGCVGQDAFGQRLKAGLQADGVDVRFVAELADAPTGIADILIKHGDNCIIVAPGANSRLSPAHVAAAQPIFVNSDVVLLQLEIPMETVEASVRLAKQLGKQVVLNPAPAAALSPELLQMVDILTPNETEAGDLTGIDTTSLEGATLAIKSLLKKGVGQVVITMGAQGALYSDGAGVHHVPALPAKVIDTTAAGDSFSAAVALMCARGESLGAAVAYGTKVGALTVRKKGAQDSLPTAKEVAETFGVDC